MDFNSTRIIRGSKEIALGKVVEVGDFGGAAGTSDGGVAAARCGGDFWA